MIDLEKISAWLGTPILAVGETSLSLGQLLSVLLFALLGILFVVWSARLLRRRLSNRPNVSADVIQLLNRAYLILGFIIVGFLALDFLQVPLTAFAFISGAVAIGVGFG
ncbi:MAG: mechanosensitive ion channel protein, partial [Halioglobus sp.]|nr:mechanosensitive ion channel protein [Halioglobus sp.]